VVPVKASLLLLLAAPGPREGPARIEELRRSYLEAVRKVNADHAAALE
jgi:hypothetical protein